MILASRAIELYVASFIPASIALRRVDSERPSRFVKTVQPLCTSLLDTAEPMAPAAITAIVVAIVDDSCKQVVFSRAQGISLSVHVTDNGDNNNRPTHWNDIDHRERRKVVSDTEWMRRIV